MSASTTPCCSPLELNSKCNTKNKDICCSKKGKSNNTPNQNKGICSPFFTCGICSGFTIHSIEINLLCNHTFKSIVFAPCFLNFPDDCFIDKWQPPKLILMSKHFKSIFNI